MLIKRHCVTSRTAHTK